jgi:hypothetical protein
MNKLLIFATALLVCISCSKKTFDITGIWQDSPMVGSGWTDTYQFFGNGSFKFNYNQMKCDKRTIVLIGDWKIDNDGILSLAINQKIIHEGGVLIPAKGSCASEFEIDGGEIKTIELNIPEKLQIKLEDFKIDKAQADRECINFDTRRYWRINTNPDAY